MENKFKVYKIEVVATEPYVDIHLVRWLLEVDGIEIYSIEEK